MAGALGTHVGDAYGDRADVLGSELGGGATGVGTIRLGGVGTFGKGGKDGASSQYGHGAGRLVARRAQPVEVVQGVALVKGALDKEIIRRVIRRHANEVKFCYERELLRNPELFGRLMVQFTISGQGSVLAAALQTSTINNTTVEQCVVAAVRRWEFPEPAGGGIAVVSYPFVMKAAGVE